MEREMTAPASQFVDTCGYRTHYIESGSGRPLILVHGGGAGADARGNWERFSMPLFSASFRTIAYDMVGFGYTDAPSPDDFVYNPESRVAQLIAFIEALGVGPVDIVGNSMGGRTSLAVAIERPDLIGNLVLMGSAGLDRSMGGVLRALTEYDFTFEGMQRIVEALTNDGFPLDKDLINYRLELSKQPAQRAAFGATMGILKARGGLHIEDDLIAQVKHRTLVVQGKDDKVIPVTMAYRYLELLENSTGVILPHCGHWAMIEHPAKFASVVTEFLRGNL
ncbi:MAG: alpha/beta fold hydrolase [Sphingomonadales bacterium]|nr:alpha/beta fold hydrolase [Sphingomonadales bacterium]